MIKGKKCGSEKYVKNGKVRWQQRYLCKACGCNFESSHLKIDEIKIIQISARIYW